MDEGRSSKKSVILQGYRFSIESPRKHFPDAELWFQSTGIRAWDYALHDWSRGFDVHDVGPQLYYAGIKAMRQDVWYWYTKQGPERPIYFTQAHEEVPASHAYPLAEMEAEFGKGRFGCQLDFMMALALHEKFERIIFHGNGAPYVPGGPEEKRRDLWISRHWSVLWWIGLAEARGVEIVYAGPCMFRHFDGNYGFDMGPKDITDVKEIAG